tara:strand:- start:12365 stop:14866 length:2502 start_codon:yes stop_codon:yes gene_type:complete
MRNIILQDKVSSPSTELQLVVDEEEGGIERWREFRAPKLPPRRTQGALTVSEQDPLIDFTWAQDDWSDGALRPYYREGDRKYALAKGVDARWEGVLSLGMEQSAPMDYLIRGMRAEQSADVSVWTTDGSDTNPTLTRQTSEVESGSYSYQFTVTTASGQDSYILQNLTNPELYRGRQLIVGCWIKTATLGSSFAPNIYIKDSAGTTSGTAITASDQNWTFVSATRTIDASASFVRIMIGDDDTATGATTCTFYFDSISVQVDGSNDDVCVGMATDGGKIYHAQGPVVAEWNEQNDVWDAVYIHASAKATDIIHFGNQIWVAFGYGDNYIYGSGTSWTVSSLTDELAHAKYFATARNNAGEMALWKTETANTIKSSTNPAGSWSSAYTIGSADRTITALHTCFDTILVGKEDGLWQYSRTYAGTASAENVFMPMFTEWDKGVNTDNFSVGQEWHGFFYTTAASQSLIRWSPGQLQDITSLILQPRIPGYGGEVRAMVAAPHELWIAADIPETAEAGVFSDFPLQMTATSKMTKLISLRMDSQGQFNIHTLDEVNFGEIDAMHVYTDTTTGHRYIVMGGRLNRAGTDADHAQLFRWQLPVRSAAPFIDAETPLTTSGEFDTSVWHGGVPGTSKAFLKAVFWVDKLDAQSTGNNRKITVKYGLDGEDSETYTLGTIYMDNSSDRVKTLYFNDATVTTGGATINPLTQAVGRSIQMRFSFATDDGADTDPPRMFAFEIHSTLRPKKLRTWEVYVRIGEDMMQETGYYQPVSKTKQLTDLDTLEDQVFPIYMKHTYDGHAGFDEEASLNCTIVDRERVSIGDEYEIHKIVLQEVDTSA